MTTYYTRKDQVSLRPGEKLGFTTGKGYYAISAPTPAPAPAPAAKPTTPAPTAAVSPTPGTPVVATPAAATRVSTPVSSPTATANARQPIAVASLAATIARELAAANAGPAATLHAIQPTQASNAGPKVAYHPEQFHPPAPAGATRELAKLTGTHGIVASVTVEAAAPQRDRATAMARATRSLQAEQKNTTVDMTGRSQPKPASPSPRDTGRHPSVPQVRVTVDSKDVSLTVGNKHYLNHQANIGISADHEIRVSVDNTTTVVTLSQRENREIARLHNSSVEKTRIVSPMVTVVAAKIAGIPVSLACAILEHESSGGLNEWGHDTGHGAIFAGGYDRAHAKQYPEFPISKAAYDAYKAQRGTETHGTAPHQQGVGPG